MCIQLHYASGSVKRTGGELARVRDVEVLRMIVLGWGVHGGEGSPYPLEFRRSMVELVRAGGLRSSWLAAPRSSRCLRLGSPTPLAVLGRGSWPRALIHF